MLCGGGYIVGNRGRKATRAKNEPAAARAESLLLRLQSAFDRYPNALVRAAQYVLENPEKVIHQSLGQRRTMLACPVSE
jgi:hypothetical protein